MKNDKLNKDDNTGKPLLCAVYCHMVETEKRILNIVSKHKELNDVDKSIIENEYGKIIGIFDSVGCREGLLLNFE